MKQDALARRKSYVDIGGARVAYQDAGAGPPLLLLHGCPFSSFIWRRIIARLSAHYRCLAPDLLGLGDTETPAGADWSLRAQASMVVGFLDVLGMARTHIIGHDHGGAVAQLLAAEHPERIDRLVLSNVEAYDNWPSDRERPFVTATRIPVLGDAVMWLYARKALFRLALIEGRAVKDPAVLTSELLDGYIRANLGDRRRRAKTRRFLAGQLDATNNRTTLDLLGGLRRFQRPVLLLWGADDVHFGVEWAERLFREIPGAVRLEAVPDAGHLVMEEKPARFAASVLSFLSEPLAELRQ